MGEDVGVERDFDHRKNFQFRLNELFGRSGHRLTNRRVVNEIATQSGVRMSTVYLSQLRSGSRVAPSDSIVVALAVYFKVSPEYFFMAMAGDSDTTVEITDYTTINGLSDSPLKMLLAVANGLSGDSMDYLSRLATKLRVVDNCSSTLADGGFSTDTQGTCGVLAPDVGQYRRKAGIR